MHKIFSNLKGFVLFDFCVDGEGWDDTANTGDKSNEYSFCYPGDGVGHGENLNEDDGDGGTLDVYFSDGSYYGDGFGDNKLIKVDDLFYLDKEELIDA